MIFLPRLLLQRSPPPKGYRVQPISIVVHTNGNTNTHTHTHKLRTLKTLLTVTYKTGFSDVARLSQNILLKPRCRPCLQITVQKFHRRDGRSVQPLDKELPPHSERGTKNATSAKARTVVSRQFGKSWANQARTQSETICTPRLLAWVKRGQPVYSSHSKHLISRVSFCHISLSEWRGRQNSTIIIIIYIYYILAQS
jgi:hypothetical protein